MGKSMNGQLSMFGPTISEDSISVTSSLASVDGVSPFDSPAGTTIGKSGPAVALVSRGARRGAALAPTIPAIFGRRGFGSSRSSDLALSLVSRLRARMVVHGSTGQPATWKPLTTPSGRLIYQRAASERVMFGADSGLWPTPVRDDAAGRILGNPHLTGNGTWRHRNRAGGQSCARLAQVCNHLGRPDLATSVAFRLQLMGYPMSWLDAMPSVTPSFQRSARPSLKPISE